MAGDDLEDLVSEAQDALPDSPLGDVADFDRVVAEIDKVCTLPQDGFQIEQLEANR